MTIHSKYIPAFGLLLFFSLFLPVKGKGQDTINRVREFLTKYPDIQEFRIADISIHGNEQTKPFIILRELDFKEGDTLKIKNLKSTIERNEKQVRNTQLFVTVKIIPHWNSYGEARIIVGVQERWYTFPKPIFQLADRNFNEWWVERDHDLSRTEYGVKFYQENIRGRNEELQLVTRFGFSQELALYYTMPYISKTGNTGLKAGASYSRNKEISYNSAGNNLTFYEGKDYIRRNFSATAKVTRRNGINFQHALQGTFFSNWVDPKIPELNENYYEKNENIQRFFKLRYQYERDFRDLISYATSGSLLRVELKKLGLGIFNDVDLTMLDLTYQRFLPLGGNFYWASSVGAQYSLPGKQPFSLERGLGYGQRLVRGYEYYVVDGQTYGVNRNSLRYEVFDTKIESFRFIPIEKFQTIPLALYFKVYGDQGYVIDQYKEAENPLANQYLAGWGAGLDIVTYYDIVFRMEYSFNREGEQDLFLHFVKAF